MALVLSKKESEIVREALEISKLIFSLDNRHYCNCVLNRLGDIPDVDSVRKLILKHLSEGGDNHILFIIPFCIGYYGCITEDIWGVIRDMMFKDKLIKY